MIPASAYAEGEPRSPRGERPSFHAMWEKHDADGDGFLSIAEFKSMPRIARLPEDKQRQLFNRFDKNKDGKISREELRDMRHARVQNRPTHGMRRLMELDVDGSGGVSLEEFRVAEFLANLPPERIEALFRRLDTDGDGQITPKDRPEFSPMFRRGEGGHGERSAPYRRFFNRLDADQSGSIDIDEFRKARGIASMDEEAKIALFDRLDVDGDQNLSMEEFVKAPFFGAAMRLRRGDEGPEKPQSGARFGPSGDD